jgi:hypothetical protein
MERISAWAEHRAAPVVATTTMLVVVMAYSLLGHPLLHIGRHALLAPSDYLSLVNSSSAILHGRFGLIYGNDAALVSPPALEVVLVPVIALGHLVGLSPADRHLSGEPLSMWLVTGPAAVLMASTVLFALDAVARWWRLTRRSRVALALAGALGVGNVVGGWGHPEDCVALALVVWAALALDRRGRAGAARAALLLGLAMAFQPLAVIGVVPVLARLGWRGAARLWPRLVVPSLVVLVPPLLGQAHHTAFVLVHQPVELAHNSLTPLSGLAPSIGPGLHGGGPTRRVAVALGAVLGALVCRRRHDLATVLTVTAIGFALRVMLETELNWYYLWPVAALCLALSLRRSPVRFGFCTAALVASMVLGNRQVHHIALWWPALMATLVCMLLSIGPSPRRWATLGGAGSRRAGRRRVGPVPPPSTVRSRGSDGERSTAR